MATTAISTTPRVWIGCLACYNAGRLVGDWYDAITADEITTYVIHGAHSRADSHDELWVMDHENIPVKGEMSPADAAAWGRAIAEVDEQFRLALIAWVESGDYVAEGNSDLPCIPDFMERYCGEWDSFNDYAEDLVESTGMLSEIPEEVARYFDHAAFARDIAFDYATYDAPNGGVFVFRIL